MQITLPESLFPWAEQTATRRGYRSVSDYVADLLAKERDEDDDCNDVIIQHKSEIEARLSANMKSGPPIPVNDDFWAERRRVLEQRLANRNGG
jgi:hypothetical protein